MKKLYLFLLIFPIIGISQNACKKCSEFSVNNNWTELISCISAEIIESENINDYMCRVQCYGAIFQSPDSIFLNLNKNKTFCTKKDILNLTLTDLDIIIKRDSLFANGIPSKQRIHIEKLLKQHK